MPDSWDNPGSPLRVPHRFAPIKPGGEVPEFPVIFVGGPADSEQDFLQHSLPLWVSRGGTDYRYMGTNKSGTRTMYVARSVVSELRAYETSKFPLIISEWGADADA